MFDHIQPVKITPRAIDEIKKIMEQKNIPSDYQLRVGVKQEGGCSGNSLIIGFDKKKETDLSYNISGFPVILDKKHTLYLIGKEVDYIDTEEVKGFIFLDEEKPPIEKNI